MSDLKIDDYQKKANETAIYPGKGGIMGLAYTVLGLTGEAGEVANKVKKILRDADGTMTEEMRTKIREELGGVAWYLAQTATELGVPLSLIAQENLDILAKRKAEGKIKGSGDDRGTSRDPAGWSGGQCIDCHGCGTPMGCSNCGKIREVPPVDRTQKVTSNGKPATCGGPAPGPINPATGQHESYWVLSEEERAKGFVRPVRRTYLHTCGCATTMGVAIAETYARDQKFYTSTFCCACQKHFPVEEFTWNGTSEKVGS